MEELRVQRDSKDAEARRYKVRVCSLLMNILCRLDVCRNSLKWSHKDEKGSVANWKWLENTEITIGAVSLYNCY